MRTRVTATLVAVATVAGVGANAPTISASSQPALGPLVECPADWIDVGDGYGGFWCETSWSCPSGTFVDHNGNGTVEYGECMIGPNASDGTTPGGQPTTSPPATSPPPPSTPSTPAATSPATPPATPAPANPTEPPAPTDAPATTAVPINPNPTLVPSLDVTDPADLPPSDPALTITVAEVLCNGLIHVEYDTAANPAPADETSHVVLFNPSAHAVDFHVAEFTGQGPNGSFTFEQLGSVDDTYRVFVTVVFDPTTPGSVSLTSWADAAVRPDC